MEVIDIAKYSSHTIKAQTALKTSPMHFLFPDNVILETCLVRGGATVSDEDTLRHSVQPTMGVPDVHSADDGGSDSNKGSEVSCVPCGSSVNSPPSPCRAEADTGAPRSLTQDYKLLSNRTHLWAQSAAHSQSFAAELWTGASASAVGLSGIS